jgi:hypothetical protein
MKMRRLWQLIQGVPAQQKEHTPFLTHTTAYLSATATTTPVVQPLMQTELLVHLSTPNALDITLSTARDRSLRLLNALSRLLM